MFIITVLDTSTNETEIIDCFNDELNCQNEYLNKISELSNRNDNNNTGSIYEPIFIQKINITSIVRILDGSLIQKC